MLTITTNLYDHSEPTARLAWKNIAPRYVNAGTDPEGQLGERHDPETHLIPRVLQGAGPAAYNLGNGNGFSVQEVIDTATRLTGRLIPVLDAPQREGDPARLVAKSVAARRELSRQPAHLDVVSIIEDGWRWKCPAWPAKPGEPRTANAPALLCRTQISSKR